MAGTRTFAEMGVSPAVYSEIRQKLEDAGYRHAVDARGCLDMHGIVLVMEIDGVHKSDCAIYNAPALEPGPCDCGGGG